MPPLYKYLSNKYVDSFLQYGEVLFRPLSYFRDYEDENVREDEFEGTRLHRPKQGLEITLTETQKKIVLPHSFESTANENDIFVFCLSTVLSGDLAKKFKTDACIEIHRPAFFISKVRAALRIRPSIKDKTLVHGAVRYYEKEEPPNVDWALPERIAMSKLSAYADQLEYRMAFAVNDAFRVENTHIRLTPPGERRFPRQGDYSNHLFRLGNLKNLCRVIQFE